ncbi:MAG: hypothetical protein MR410_06985 [Eubacterium sp.]|nr:hypothetical protein [Eubacterium sp.]
MIKKLRVKMVIATMLSLLVVLSVIIGSVGILNYREIVSNADITLGILAENDGRFPDSAFSKGEFQKRDHRLSPELPEVRSFLRTVRGKNFCPGNRRMRILLYC